MKKVVDWLITLMIAVAAALFIVTSGSSIMKWLPGSSELGEREFQEAEGQYISYIVNNPVARYDKEYTSGDKKEVMVYEYPVYDKELQMILATAVSRYDKTPMDSLQTAVSWPKEWEAEYGKKEIRPVEVKGTLERMEEDQIEAVMEAIAEENPQDLDEILRLAKNQTDWYWIQDKHIDGIEGYQLRFSLIAIVLSAAIAVARIISALFGKKKSGEGIKKYLSDNSNPSQLISMAAPAMEQWIREYQARQKRNIYMTGVVIVAILAGICELAGAREQAMLFHIPLGVVIGEVIGCIYWLIVQSQTGEKSVVKACRKGIAKSLPSKEEQEAAAGDALEAGKEWMKVVRSKNFLNIYICGSRYWCRLSVLAWSSVVDSDRLEKMETEHVISTYRNSTGKFTSEDYVIRFFYKGNQKKKTCAEYWSFYSQEVCGAMLHMIRQRIGDGVEVIAK